MVDRAQRSGERTVVGNVDLVAQLVVRQPQGAHHHEDQGRDQPPEELGLQCAVALFCTESFRRLRANACL